MAVMKRPRCLLREKKGDGAVSFLMTTAMLVLIFAVLVSAMIYIMQYYNASYMCRRVVRSIEITGVYDEAKTRSLISSLSGSDMEDIQIQVDAVYYSGRKIQLRQTFSVTLKGSYRITILTLGGNPVALENVGGTWQFPVNGSSVTGARKIYIPVETKDGIYTITFTVKALDPQATALTGSNVCLTLTKSATVTVKGDMYSDDFTGSS